MSDQLHVSGGCTLVSDIYINERYNSYLYRSNTRVVLHELQIKYYVIFVMVRYFTKDCHIT
jgi:hypothetical protein